jgi:disulfide bond formation protein DsbB
MQQTDFKKQINALLLIQLSVSLAAIFGSLFFSEVMRFPPCDLCWYQRIFMYPIALLILVGLFLDSKDTLKFVAPLIWGGLIIAFYHNLVYYKVIQVIVPCNEAAPCTAQHVNYMGFLTIPLMSLLGFLFLALINFLALTIQKKDLHHEK